MGYGEYPTLLELGASKEAYPKLLTRACWAAEFLLGLPVVERRVEELLLPAIGAQLLTEWPVRDVKLSGGGWEGEVDFINGRVLKRVPPSQEIRIAYTIGYSKDVPAVVKALVTLLMKIELGQEVDRQELTEMVEVGRWQRKSAEKERARV